MTFSTGRSARSASSPRPASARRRARVHARPVVADRQRGGGEEQHERGVQPVGVAEVTVVVAEEDQRHAGEELEAEEDRDLLLHDVGPPQHGRRWRAAATRPRKISAPLGPSSTIPASTCTKRTTSSSTGRDCHATPLIRRSSAAHGPRPARAYSRARMRCGADTGGTFTDVVVDDGRVAKVLSTPTDPASRAVAAALGARARRAARPRHDRGHQRAARAARAPGRAGHQRGLRRRDRDRPPGPPVALRHRRRPARAAGAARELRLEVGGRLDADGREVEPVDPDAVPPLPEGIEAVAVCLLHADLDAGARASAGGARCAARGTSTSRARARCRPSSASTSGR